MFGRTSRGDCCLVAVLCVSILQHAPHVEQVQIYKHWFNVTSEQPEAAMHSEAVPA